MDSIPKVGELGSPQAIGGDSRLRGNLSDGFGEALQDAIRAVDDVQKQSEAAQQAFVQHEDVDLHDVLIKIEQAEIAFKTMMEVRNKLVDSYREIMRMGS